MKRSRKVSGVLRAATLPVAISLGAIAGLPAASACAPYTRMQKPPCNPCAGHMPSTMGSQNMPANPCAARRPMMQNNAMMQGANPCATQNPCEMHKNMMNNPRSSNMR